MTDLTKVQEAITNWFGPRCADYEPGCHVCEVWREFDGAAEVGRLVFMNAVSKPKNVSVQVSPESVADVMSWYGAFSAGDRYTVEFNGKKVPMDQDGGPLTKAADLV